MKSLNNWGQRNEQVSRDLLDSMGKVRSDYRYCESCRSYKPKNRQPAVKGWHCTDCAMVKA